QAAGRHHHVLGGDGVALVGLHPPGAGRLVPVGGGHPCVELDVATQVETVGHVPGVLEDLRLGRVALRPAVLLLQVRGEGERVVDAFHVDPGTRVAVPVPGSADVIAGLEHDAAQAEPAQPVQHVHAGEAGADDHDIGCLGAGGGFGG